MLQSVVFWRKSFWGNWASRWTIPRFELPSLVASVLAPARQRKREGESHKNLQALRAGLVKVRKSEGMIKRPR